MFGYTNFMDDAYIVNLPTCIVYRKLLYYGC